MALDKPFKLTITKEFYHHNNDIWWWCRKRLNQDDWEVEAAFGHMTYYFRSKEIYTLFYLTWGEYVNG